MTKDEVFRKIAVASNFGNLGFFVGAGYSMAMFPVGWEKPKPLSWKQLLREAAERNQFEWKDDDSKKYKSCPQIASELCSELSKSKSISYEDAVLKIKETICSITAWYPETSYINKYSQIMKNIRPKWIVTTNYDFVLESIYKDGYTSLGANDRFVLSDLSVPIFHMHGIRTNPASIVITNEDYTKLFRPNEYRLEKLALTFNESTTVVMGYSMGDSNVLTALDWAKEIYHSEDNHYPHDVIQIVYEEDDKLNDLVEEKSGIIYLHTTSLLDTLKEISECKNDYLKECDSKEKLLIAIRAGFTNSSTDDILEFIENEATRLTKIDVFNTYHNELMSVFEIFLAKVYDQCWERAKPKNAFYAYAEMTKILLDLIIRIPYENMGPVLFSSIAGWLRCLSTYIGTSPGCSYEADNIWNKRKCDIPNEMKNELKNYAYKYRYSIAALLH